MFRFALLDVLSGDSVEHSASLRGEDTGVELEVISFLIFFDQFELFQLLKTPSDDLG